MTAPSRTYTTRGIVLRARNLGEADKIVTLFTDERGKLDAVAKGVRRPKSKLAGKLEFASDVTFEMHRGRNLDVVTGASLDCEYWSRLVHPNRFATAHLVVELIDAFCELDYALPEVSALLRGVLGAIARSSDPATLVPRFELRLLAALGIGPVADACVRCSASLEGGAAWADLEAGGLACAACRPYRADAYALDAEGVANFRGLSAGPREAIAAQLVALPAAGRAADAFVLWHLGKRPKARAFVDEFASG